MSKQAEGTVIRDGMIFNELTGERLFGAPPSNRTKIAYETATTEEERSKSPKAPVTMRALIQRINRKLASDDREKGNQWPQKVCAFRGRARENVGAYYLLDQHRNEIVNSGISPEHLARELGVLQLWEAVVEDD